MSKRANAGELRTLIQIKRRTVTTNANGFDTETYENVYGDGQYVHCKWVGNHGKEVFNRDTYAELRTATLTMRFSELADDGTLVVFLNGDDTPWEVVNVDNVEQRNQWLELSVQKKIRAR